MKFYIKILFSGGLALFLFLRFVNAEEVSEKATSENNNSVPTLPIVIPDDEFFDDEYASMTVDVYDPFEGYNRMMFAFNDKLYDYTLRPFAKGYAWLVPAAPRRGISNFFTNLGFPIRLISNIFQLKFKEGGREVGKFLLNSTVGIAGLFKVSDRVACLADNGPTADFGQMLGTWGMKKGPFIVLPLAGPMVFRDGVAWGAGYFAWPTAWHWTQDRVSHRVQYAFDVLMPLNTTPEIIKTYDLTLKGAIDPYIAMRNGYVQYRDSSIKNPPRSVPHVPPPLRKGKPRSR